MNVMRSLSAIGFSVSCRVLFCCPVRAVKTPNSSRGSRPCSIVRRNWPRPPGRSSASSTPSIPTPCEKKIRQKPIPEYKGRVLQRRVNEITGLPCVLVHHAEVTRKDFDRPNVTAILLMARAKAINKDLDKELFALIRETKIPMIGFCGGLQLIVQAYGGRSTTCAS